MEKIRSKETAERMTDAIQKYVEKVVMLGVTDAKRQNELRTALKDGASALKLDLINAFRFGGFD
jgi:hypothetical protein